MKKSKLQKKSSHSKILTKNKSHQIEKNIFIAFILNLGFSIYEFIGGTITGSVSIISDAVHDIGDALSIGLAFLLEKKSRQKPNNRYTYGYVRYSLIGSLITTFILIFGSIFVIYQATIRLFHPTEIHYDGMIILAVIGVIVNYGAAHLTSHGDSLNQKSVNLHMLEDVLGWIAVLIGAIVMRFTDWSFIDPILSIFVALFILKEALVNGRNAISVFLEKTPSNIDLSTVQQAIIEIPGVEDIHHLHVWSIDGYHNYATLHLVAKQDSTTIKTAIRQTLKKFHIEHVTIETETPGTICQDQTCPNLSPIKHHHAH